jgi:hypothetical protein
MKRLRLDELLPLSVFASGLPAIDRHGATANGASAGNNPRTLGPSSVPLYGSASKTTSP